MATNLSSAFQVASRLAVLFEHLKLRYLVGGSLAGSFYGEPGSTSDADLVAEISLALLRAQ